MPIWDPAQYAKFGDHRGRPFGDLLTRVGATGPGLVVDMGCGDGPLTLQLADRWPQARVIGVDASPAMLERARALDAAGRVEWVQSRAQDWQPPDGMDVLVTNAALQWVPGHQPLIGQWIAALAEGGWFAMQVPGNFASPSHALLREVAAASPRARELTAALRHDDAVGEPPAYLELLTGLGLRADVWETTYLQVLDPAGEQSSPVLEWVKGTALRPVLDLLTEPGERAAFLAAYARRLDAAYPRRPFGTLFPFRRIFAVGHKER